MFWGITLENAKIYSQIVDSAFQVSMASLEPQLGLKNELVGVNIVHCKQEYLLCTLEHGVLHQQPLDLKFCEGEEVSFLTTGSGVVHLTGFHFENLDSVLPDADFVNRRDRISNNISASELSSQEDSDEESDNCEDTEDECSLSLLADEIQSDSEDDDWKPKNDEESDTCENTSNECSLSLLADDIPSDSEDGDWKPENDIKMASPLKKSKKMSKKESRESNVETFDETAEIQDASLQSENKISDIDMTSPSKKSKKASKKKKLLESIVVETLEETAEMQDESSLSGNKISASPTKSDDSDNCTTDDDDDTSEEDTSEEDNCEEDTGTATILTAHENLSNSKGSNWNIKKDIEMRSPQKKSKKKKSIIVCDYPTNTSGLKKRKLSDTIDRTREDIEHHATEILEKKKKKLKNSEINDEIANSGTAKKSHSNINRSQGATNESKISPENKIWTTGAGGCKYRDLLTGHGPIARKGATAHFYYEGKNIRAEVFDSVMSGNPYKLKLGSKSFLLGLHHGMKGMRVGGKRKIIIPPSQGYGQNGLKGKVPPNSNMFFTVELKAVS